MMSTLLFPIHAVRLVHSHVVSLIDRALQHIGKITHFYMFTGFSTSREKTL